MPGQDIMKLGGGVTMGLRALASMSNIRKADFSAKLTDQVLSFQQKGFVLIRASQNKGLLDKTEDLNKEILRWAKLTFRTDLLSCHLIFSFS